MDLLSLTPEESGTRRLGYAAAGLRFQAQTHTGSARPASGWNTHCTRFTMKSLSGQDPLMSADSPSGNQDMVASAAEIESRAVSSWGSQLDLTMVPPAEDVLELDYMEDEEDTSEFLLSDSDGDDIFVSAAQAAMSAPPGESTPASPVLSMDLQAVCQRTASRLDIPWSEVAKETLRYEGNNLPQAERTKRQLLPVFPEMLDEVAVSWRDRPFSNKAPIQGASSLDCDGMERLGLLRMPPSVSPIIKKF
ncbi:hypothetical protein CgunFtcFv8_027607 [Champsocephalus gunnari]|uniref:Uncharacterized protein n=1 Tax=Champsocephalus gunnari TaxID=52237 RepID=A0AAN8EK68_CHAGU|nr:hypothetical protein CgunFtcFv8_027607 [Champsocephalus gunnari]